MKKGFSLVLVGILVLSFYIPVAAPDGEMVSVIFETDNKQALGNVIEVAGGTVTIEYETVPMLAADVPLLSLEDIQKNPHCLYAHKDKIQYLPDPPEAEGDSDAFEAQEIMDISDHVMGSYTLEELANLPENYYNYMITGANTVWPSTVYGQGTLVAVIDTGTYPYHPCLYPRVIGGISFAPNEPVDSWDDVDNHYHGTAVACIIASNCAVLLPDTDVWAMAIMKHAPPGSWFVDPNYPGYIVVPLLGMAPLAEIYAIKVFPKSGAGVPSSVIMQGLDHAIHMRKLYDATGGAEGYLIDVINMSLGGGTGYCRRNPLDLLVDEATKAGIVVVVAAGNNGPALRTISSPATARTSISVGAAVDPVHARIGWEIVFNMVCIGQILYPSNDIQIAYFSSRGPTCCGCPAPDVVASGVYIMTCFPPYSIGIMSGTSASCPVVAGAAALLANWQKIATGSANPYQIKKAINDGAVPLTLPYSPFAQGNGYLNVPNSLALLQSGITGGLQVPCNNILNGINLQGGTQTWSTGSLQSGCTFDIVIAVDEDTERLDICLDNVSIPGPQNPLLGDSIEFYVQSAIRTAEGYYIYSENIYNTTCFTIPDPNPGDIRFVVEGDWTNWGTVSCDVTVTETEGRTPCNIYDFGTIGNDEWIVHYVYVPDGLGAVLFELWWMHNWSMHTTYDLDMYIFDPDGNLYLDGAQFWSPEKQVIYNPIPGTYTVLVYGYEIYHGKDPYELRVCYIY